MSRTFRNLMLALMTVTTVAFASCEKEQVKPDNPDQGGGDTTELTTMSGTSWVGIYDDSYQGYPAEITYSLDFTSETEGSLLIELKVNGVDQNPQSVNFTYTFSNNVAMCTIPNAGPFSATYDPQTNTVTASVALGTEDGGAIGGTTTFYPRGTNPIPHSGNGGGDTPGQGEYTEDFPAGSTWTASEAATYQGTPIEVFYTLTYDNYHAGTIVIDVRMQGQSIGGQTLNHTWTYNAETAQGAFMLQGNGINFFYDAAGDHITTSLPLGFSESETFGSDLVFSRN